MSIKSILTASLFVPTFISSQLSHTDTYSNAVLSDNPFAYYRFGEASGTTAFDQTAGGRDGTYLNGTTLGVGGSVTDTAAQFDSLDDYVQV